MADSADIVTVERSSELRRVDLDPEPFLGFGEGLRVEAGGAFLEHADHQRLDAARGRRVGGIAGVEADRELGDRHGVALRIIDRDARWPRWCG